MQLFTLFSIPYEGGGCLKKALYKIAGDVLGIYIRPFSVKITINIKKSRETTSGDCSDFMSWITSNRKSAYGRRNGKNFSRIVNEFCIFEKQSRDGL